MKERNANAFLMVAVVCALATMPSCVVRQYRVFETRWQQRSTTSFDDPAESQFVVVKPWCWSDQGRLRMVVENVSDSVVYIDLQSCFLAVDSIYFVYITDTTDRPVLFGVAKASATQDWTKIVMNQETCDRYIMLLPDQIVLSKFVLHSIVKSFIPAADEEGESVLYDSQTTPVFCAHGIGYLIGQSDSICAADHEFYLSAKRKWIYKHPERVYLPDNRQSNYYIRNKTIHPLGTFFILGLVSYSIHLGTSN
jgi:hypothetical protein